MAAITISSEKDRFKRSRAPLHLDMTPMVDLAFLLLTFFVMTTHLLQPTAMQLDMPDKVDDHVQPPIQGDRVLNLVLGKDDKIHWYMGAPGVEHASTDFSSSGVRKLLIDKRNEIKKLYVLVKPSEQSRYQNVVDIIDELAISGVEHYAIVDMDAEDERLY